MKNLENKIAIITGGGSVWQSYSIEICRAKEPMS